MNEIEHEYDFNAPVELTEIFRVLEVKEESKEIDGEMRTGIMEQKVEYSSKNSICWEDIQAIKTYPYPDDWVIYKGDKFWVHLYDYPHDILILGNYHSIKAYWTEFRTTYPRFIREDGANDEHGA